MFGRDRVHELLFADEFALPADQDAKDIERAGSQLHPHRYRGAIQAMKRTAVAVQHELAKANLNRFDRRIHGKPSPR